jgi:hypothetical protein
MAGRVSETKKSRTVAALLTAPTVAEAARVAGVAERTIYRWLANDPAFVADLRSAEAAAIDHAARRLVGLQDDAISVLGDVIADTDAAPGVRVRAAALIVDLSLRLRELRSLEERVAALEAAQHG